MRVNIHLTSLVLSIILLGMCPCAFAADKVVHSVEELDDTLRDRTFTGRVIIPKDSVWLMERCDKKDAAGNVVCTPVVEGPIYSVVTLVGGRGALGS